MKILFCTDGSKISYNAVKNASEWIKEAVVDIICVIDWSFLPDDITLEASNFSMSCANVADTVLDYAEKLVIDSGFEIGKKIKHCGSAIESILEQGENENYDLIMMGSNGKKGIQKWLGSVSQEIINSSKVSDYIAKEENKKQKLLLTTDGTICSAGIIREILPHLKLEDKEIYICMVNEDPSFLFLDGNIDQNWLQDIYRKQHKYASSSIKEIQDILSEYNVDVTGTAVLTGNPAQEIINYTQKNKIDLVVLGSRNKSRLDRFLTGSESKRILENTMSDVWLIRCTK
ncbi:universal stress protein [bacterium]|nr:universal stress protein [bacterium]